MAVGDAHVFPRILTPAPTHLSLQSHRLLLSDASAEVRGKNTPERKFASTWYQNHNRRVMSLSCSPLGNFMINVINQIMPSFSFIIHHYKKLYKLLLSAKIRATFHLIAYAENLRMQFM